MKKNKPVDEGEVNELIRLIVDWDTYDYAKGIRYSGARWHKSLMIYASKEALWLDHETMREYMLDVLDGLKEELNTIEHHAVGGAA